MVWFDRQPNLQKIKYEILTFKFTSVGKLHDSTKRICPKCKNKNYGHLFLAGNLYKGKSTVMCFYAYCDFQMNIVDWNNKYKRSQFRDPGFSEWVGENSHETSGLTIPCVNNSAWDIVSERYIKSAAKKLDKDILD